tara:strand:+ start:3227 stop:3457 length:231 start_codon:yes stop_codon:yes gene_type:complete
MDINELNNIFNRIDDKSKSLDIDLINISNNIKKKEMKDRYDNIFENTYLQSKEDIIELYKLFIFYGLMESYFDNYI